MAIRIAVCDDEEEQLQSLSGLLAKWTGHSGLSLDMHISLSGSVPLRL